MSYPKLVYFFHPESDSMWSYHAISEEDHDSQLIDPMVVEISKEEFDNHPEYH